MQALARDVGAQRTRTSLPPAGMFSRCTTAGASRRAGPPPQPSSIRRVSRLGQRGFRGAVVIGARDFAGDQRASMEQGEKAIRSSPSCSASCSIRAPGSPARAAWTRRCSGWPKGRALLTCGTPSASAQRVQRLDGAAPAQHRAQYRHAGGLAAGGRRLRKDAQRQGRAKGDARLLARGAGALGRDGEYGSARNAAFRELSQEPARNPQGEHRPAPRAAGAWRPSTARCSAIRRGRNSTTCIAP